MFKTLFVYLKYPSAAGIIGIMWIGTVIMLINQPQLPIVELLIKNLGTSLVIAYIGFRVDKK